MYYTVYMVNFGDNLGSYKTLAEAIARAKAVGFECSIYRQDDETSIFVRTVRPY